MKALLLLCSSLLITPVLHAQIWCTQGATWTYGYTNGWTHDGFARYTYAGDTVMAGITAQKITMHAEGIDWMMQNYFSWDLAPCFTSIDGDLVNLWTGSAFDTLYDLGASIGDHWQMNVQEGTDPSAVLTVMDTGTLVIDGVSLHYLVITSDGWWPTDTVVERLGTLNQHFVPWSLTVLDAANGPLRCYQDVDIDHQMPDWPYGCETWLGQVEPASANEPGPVFPNPGTGQVTIVPPIQGSPISWELMDATGRTVVSIGLTNAVELPVHQIPAGAYAWRMRDPLGAWMGGGRWIKQ